MKNLQELKQVVKRLREKGNKIVWTNGCFDLLHEGHVKYLKKAKQEGDYLIVGLNSDDSVREVKGGDRPIRPEKARAEILCSLECVDEVIIFGDKDTTRHLKELKPHVYVKGGDYTIDTINQDEREIVESYGGKISLVCNDENTSTSDIIKSIRDSQ